MSLELPECVVMRCDECDTTDFSVRFYKGTPLKLAGFVCLSCDKEFVVAQPPKPPSAYPH